MDLEEIGSGSGSGPGSVCSSEHSSLCEDGYRRRRSTASSDSVYDTESTTSSRESLIESSQSLSQVHNLERSQEGSSRFAPPFTSLHPSTISAPRPAVLSAAPLRNSGTHLHQTSVTPILSVSLNPDSKPFCLNSPL